LAPYGDQAALLVEALEDFYYSELEITVDKTFDEDLSAGISLLGSNPNVLEGHPFRLNINFESNIERVAIALFAGYSAAQRALRKAWKATKEAR
jgi:hypothetical protein